MDMNLFFSWAKDQQEINKKMTNDLNPNRRFSVRHDAHLNLGGGENQNDFMRDNLHFPESNQTGKSADVISRIMSGE